MSIRLDRLKKQPHFKVALRRFGKYLKVAGRRGNWHLRFAVKGQSFQVGAFRRTDHAEVAWTRIMFAHALHVLVSEEMGLEDMVSIARGHGLKVVLALGKKKSKALSPKETQRILKSGPPIKLGKLPADPIGMRTLAARVDTARGRQKR